MTPNHEHDANPQPGEEGHVVMVERLAELLGGENR